MTTLPVAALTNRVLATWAADPRRHAEDWAAEQELAHVAHQGRVLIELLQNAADAAQQAALPGQVLVSLLPADSAAVHECVTGHTGWVLEVSNTGVAIDEAALTSMSSLRLSDKRGDDRTTGRFGVGFSAVLTASHTPIIATETGAVQYCSTRTTDLLTSHQIPTKNPSPTLRIPHPTPGHARTGYTTSIVLPLTDAAVPHIRTELAALNETVLLAFAGIDTLTITQADQPATTFTRSAVTQRWLTHERTIPVDPDPDLPQTRTDQQHIRLRWAVPNPAQHDPTNPPRVPEVLYAPAPSQVPLAWPALLIGDFPMDEARRQLIPSARTNALCQHAAELLGELATTLHTQGHDPLTLLPTTGTAGPFDADLRAAVIPHLANLPLFTPVAGPDETTPPTPICAAETTALAPGSHSADEDLLRWLALSVPGLITAPTHHDRALQHLRIRRITIADAISTIQWPHHMETSWQELATILAARLGSHEIRQATPNLATPLANGRTQPSPRGALLATELPDHTVEFLHHIGAPIIAPQLANHPAAAALFTAGGATTVTPPDVIHIPDLGTWVTQLDNELTNGHYLPDPDQPTWQTTAHFVLAALTAHTEHNTPTNTPVGTDQPFTTEQPDLPDWVPNTLIPDRDGEPVNAKYLCQPGSQLANWADPELLDPVDDDFYTTAPATTWAALGVLGDLTATPLTGIDTTECVDQITADGVEDWADTLPFGSITTGAYIAGLDLIHPDHYPAALAAIDQTPTLRRALTDPITVTDMNGTSTEHAGLSLWWLHNELDCAATALTPDAWLPQCPDAVQGLSAELRSVLGVVAGLAELSVAGWAVVLAEAEDAQPSSVAVLDLHVALARAVVAGVVGAGTVDCPGALWALDGDRGPVWCAVSQLWVPDGPMWAQRGDLGPMVLVPGAQAELVREWLGARSVADFGQSAAGMVTSVPVAQMRCPGALVDVAGVQQWCLHEELLVDQVPVRWWVAAGQVHAVDEVAAGEGLAFQCGQWRLREVFAEWLLGEPEPITTLSKMVFDT